VLSSRRGGASGSARFLLRCFDRVSLLPSLVLRARVARDTPRAPGSSRQLLCRQFRTPGLSRKPSFFLESSQRCPNNARRPGFATAALVTVSIRTCSRCPPIRPAASIDCRTRAATCRDRIAQSNGGTRVFSDSVPQSQLASISSFIQVVFNRFWSEWFIVSGSINFHGLKNFYNISNSWTSRYIGNRVARIGKLPAEKSFISSG
jgi:hypothetical protein